jgi:hypothetical protein
VRSLAFLLSLGIAHAQVPKIGQVPLRVRTYVHTPGGEASSRQRETSYQLRYSAVPFGMEGHSVVSFRWPAHMCTPLCLHASGCPSVCL